MGLPNKPNPAMVTHICRELDVSPARAVMVGDGVPDMLMGRASGVGLCVGVTSGLSDASLLAPYADVVIPSISYLVPVPRA
jgi:phosphoglycolate phosphatase